MLELIGEDGGVGAARSTDGLAGCGEAKGDAEGGFGAAEDHGRDTEAAREELVCDFEEAAGTLLVNKRANW